jgi:hypothetical protein
MHERTIGFKHEINKLKTKIKNFNRVQLKGFSSYEVGDFLMTLLGVREKE